MIHVKSLIKINNSGLNDYPFNLNLIKNLNKIEFSKDIVILVGENGSGKTTLMEIIASILGLHRINYPSLTIQDKLNKINSATNYFKVHYNLSKKGGFYFQGEDFINYLNYLNTTISESIEQIKKIDDEYKGKSDYARSQAKVPHLKTINELKNLYDGNLLTSSHGEGFISFFSSRIKGNEIYLLDEPETPLSFHNQLVMISIIKEAVNNKAQFIISTHSPLLMSIPNSDIYSIENNMLIKKEYEELEQVNSLRDFLNNKDTYLRYL